MQTTKNGKTSGAAVTVAALAVVFFLILIGATRFGRPTAPGSSDGDIFNSASQLEVTESDYKRVTFVRPEVQVTNDMITVFISTDIPMAQGEIFSAILLMPDGAARAHKFSVVTNGTQTSSVLSWEFDPKRDGLFLAAAQDALAQLGTRLKQPQTLYAGQFLPAFTVTNSNGGIVRGSIEYHVLLQRTLARRLSNR